MLYNLFILQEDAFSNFPCGDWNEPNDQSKCVLACYPAFLPFIHSGRSGPLLLFRCFSQRHFTLLLIFLSKSLSVKIWQRCILRALLLLSLAIALLTLHSCAPGPSNITHVHNGGRVNVFLMETDHPVLFMASFEPICHHGWLAAQLNRLKSNECKESTPMFLLIAEVQQYGKTLICYTLFL